ncbi:MAG: acyl-CoA carboxylase subunit beta [Chloroflexi bacterium]|nr:acyl-CoA carboxylase subunit beta [Chloroflexota bacterium]
MTMQDKLEELAQRHEASRAGGGEAAVERQHARGKLTAHERVERLFDPDSFVELDALTAHNVLEFGLADRRVPGDSVVTGYGTVDGRTVFIYAFDFTVLGGTLSLTAARKINKVQDMATRTGAPIIGIMDSGGARIQEGVDSLAGYGNVFVRNVLASGVVPQISLIMGPSAGGAVYSPAITDFIIMEEGVGQMYITGPDVIRAVTGEVVTHEQLGGATPHTTQSGVAHFAAPGEDECLDIARQLLSFMPSNNEDDPPEFSTDDPADRLCPELREMVPVNPNEPYDVREVIECIVDNGEFLEVHSRWAANIVVGLARFNGRSVGIVSQQPMVLAGTLDINAAIKAARFVRFCDAFNIPIVTLTDVPGYLPGVEQEHSGIIIHGAKLLYAYAEATVPKVSVVTRKSYGGAFLVMSSQMLRGDIGYAWPGAQMAVMGSEGAADIIFRDRIRSAENPDEERQRAIEEYNTQFLNPYIAAARGYIEDVIDPADTRKLIIRALEMLRNKRDTMPPRKHGNIPL